jgi:hypothetical protein
MLQPGSCPSVPSCPSALLPHAHMLPSSNSTKLAAMQANVRQRLPTRYTVRTPDKGLARMTTFNVGAAVGTLRMNLQHVNSFLTKQGSVSKGMVSGHLCFSPAERDDTKLSLGRLNDSRISMLCCVCACSLQQIVCRPSEAAKLSHPAAICLSSRLQGKHIIPALTQRERCQLEHTEGIDSLRGAWVPAPDYNE